jgi:ribosomal protein S18 acetylase RimI-like enzyme
MKINVRMIEEKDFEEVAKLIARLKSLNEELDPHFKAVDNVREIALKYIEETTKSDNAFILVAENGETGEIIGVIRVELVDRVFYEPRIKALITDIYVKPKYRRKRVGILLLEKAATEAKRRGAGMLSAIYPHGNVLAAEFYKKQGFSEFQREVYKPL